MIGSGTAESRPFGARGRRLAVRLACAGLLAAALAAGCDDPVGVPLDIQAASSVVEGHYHTATIPGRDVLDPPPGGREYASSIEAGHSHVVRLTEAQLFDLQQPGAVVSVNSSLAAAPGATQPHAHQFTFER